jgi:hypothetical protein
MPVFSPLKYGETCSPPLRASQSLAAMQEVPQCPGNGERKYLVANPEIESEKKGGDKHHDRRAVDFLFAWPSHTLHLRPNVGRILPNLNPRTLLNTDLLAHSSLCTPTGPRFVLGGSGRGGGIRTPTSGFGDRQSSR